jgi:hypothetical protein
LPVPAHHRGGVGEVEDDRAGVQHPQRVGAEQKAGDNAEIAATAAQRPEQVGVLRFRRGDEAAVGQHYIRLRWQPGQIAALGFASAAR